MPGVVAHVGVMVLSAFGVGAASAGLIMAVGSAAIALTVASARRVASLKDAGDVEHVSGISVPVESTEIPRIIAFGETLVGGVITYKNTTGNELRSLYIEIVHTGHEVDSFIGWYLDDKWVPVADVDVAGDGSVDTNTGGHGLDPYSGTPVLYLRRHLGTDSQTVDTMLDSAFADIGANHRHRGCAKSVVRCELVQGGESKWNGRNPQSITTVIRGMRCYDPRLDSTFPGGSGAHRLATPSTWAWTDNPALIWGRYRILAAPLGPAWDSSRIDWQSVFDAANVCDALVAIPTATTEKRFRCDLVVDASMEPREVIAKILATMGGKERHYNGQWHVFAAGWPATDFALTDDDVIGELQYRKQPQIEDRYNQVKGSYIDRARLWKRTQFISVNNTTLRTNRDNGRTLAKELDLDGVTREYQAQRLARYALNQADDTGILVVQTGYNGLNIRVGDTGTVTISELGFAQKTFRVVGWRWVDFVGAELTLKEDSSGNYTDPVEGEYSTRTAAGTITFGKVLPWYLVGPDAVPDIREDFVYVDATELHRYWTKRQGGIANADITLLTGLTDVRGGKAVRFGNNSGNDEWWGSLTKHLVPYDGTSTYEIGIIARRPAGSGGLFCGVEGIANDRVTWINRDGNNAYDTQFWFVAQGYGLSSSWETLRGYFRGYSGSPAATPTPDPSSPGPLRTDVTFVRPNLIVNYNAQAGQIDVAGIWLRRLPTVGTPNIGPDSTEVLVSSQPADGTEVIGTISYSGGGTLVDYSPITAIEWTNDTGGSVDVVLRQSARVQLSASDSLIGRKLAMRWSLNGGSSWSYDGTNTDNVNITAADWQPKSTQRTVTVANGETIDVESIVVLVIPDPTSGDPADVQYRGLSLSIESKLR